ncbi:MAG: bifunctional riboflavin kinase/FAD synthetase [Wenzhouxiangella sp.]
MQLIRHPNRLAAELPATSLAVGNFDGLHRGHQVLIEAAREGASKLVPALMCFEPLPATFFHPERPQPRLLGVRDKIRLCRHYGLDLMFMLRFNAPFARQSPERFVRDVLVRSARAGRVVVGADFRFGARAAGDVAMLEKLGRRYGFEVERVEAVRDGEDRVSSTAVRAALAEGDLTQAERLLGRPYAISGRVLRGNSLGRRLGYATVNLRPPLPPALSGILAVRVSGAGLESHPGVASLGRRPTVCGRQWLLEVHLFDYDGDLYGRHLNVEFVEFIRHEEHFESLEAMQETMSADAETAKRALARHESD